MVCRDDCWNIFADLSFNHTKMMKYLYNQIGQSRRKFGFGQSVHSGNRRSNRRYYQRYLDFTSKAKLIGQNVRRTKKQNVIRPFSGALHGLFILVFRINQLKVSNIVLRPTKYGIICSVMSNINDSQYQLIILKEEYLC